MATLPGVFAPSLTGAAMSDLAAERNFVSAKPGIQASRSMPIADSTIARTGRVLFTALTACVTIGIPANMPSLSVDVRNLSLALAPWFLKCTALARSIRCGKSRFHGCGGTYGHLVM